jgi:hypothetical protein
MRSAAGPKDLKQDAPRLSTAARGGELRNTHRSLFWKLDALSVGFVALVAAWLIFGPSLFLAALTLTASVVTALVVGHELNS